MDQRGRFNLESPLADTVALLAGERIDPDLFGIRVPRQTKTRLKVEAQQRRSLLIGNLHYRDVADHVLTAEADQLHLVDFTQNELYGGRILRVVRADAQD